MAAKEQYQEKQRRDRQLKNARSEVKKIEEEIEKLEASIAEWDVRMADPASHGVDLADPAVFERYNALKTGVNRAMKRWEELQFELEILEG